jgi:hypothetical protein
MVYTKGEGEMQLHSTLPFHCCVTFVKYILEAIVVAYLFIKKNNSYDIKKYSGAMHHVLYKGHWCP